MTKRNVKRDSPKTKKTKAAELFIAGDFYREPGGGLYFVDTETGRALPVDSPGFKTLVATITGVGRKDRAFPGILAEIEDRARAIAKPARVEHCSAYDRDRHLFLVNLGRGYVAEVTATRMRDVANGTGGVIFVDEEGFEPVDPMAIQAYDPKRALAEFSEHVLDYPPLAVLTCREAMAIGLAYWIGSFFDRTFARARPLLLLIGEIGSGKTMCSRKLGITYYGRDFEVSVGAAPDRATKDLAAAVAHSTLTVRDDLNAAPSGLIELLLCVATGAKFELSEFHKTLERISFAMRGTVVLTASRPRWARREDLLSRLLTVRVNKDRTASDSEESEEDRLARAYRARVAGWYLALDGLTHVLASTERPVTATRFRSWEQAARAALRPYGLHDDFMSALGKMGSERTQLALDADPFLGLLLAVARQHPGHAWTAAGLNDALGEAAGMMRDGMSPHVARPRNSLELGNLLEHIEVEGATVVRVERVGKAHGNVAKWKLTPLDDVTERERRACGTCASSNEPDAKFCKKCGAAMDDAQNKLKGRGGIGGIGADVISLPEKKKEKTKGASSKAGGGTPPNPPNPPVPRIRPRSARRGGR